MKSLLLMSLSLFVFGCATVRQQDLDKWQNAPVEALDFHKLFMTMPVTKTVSNGVEIRNYSNSRSVNNCTTSSTGSFLNTNCSGGNITCNNIFYIKSGRVLKYEPVGKCYTNETVWPNNDYKQFVK